MSDQLQVLIILAFLLLMAPSNANSSIETEMASRTQHHLVVQLNGSPAFPNTLCPCALIPTVSIVVLGLGTSMRGGFFVGQSHEIS